MADLAAVAIRRASQQARNAMVMLDEEAVAELQSLYERAAEEVRAAVQAAASSGRRVELARMRDLLAQVEAILQALSQARDQLLDGALVQAAELGVQPFTGQGIAATGRQVPAPLSGLQADELVDQAVGFVRAFRAADGLVLSDRLWALSRDAREVVGRTIEQAVVQGWSADRAAQELVMRGQPVPTATQQAQAAADGSNVARAADLLVDGQASPLANATRVMRTEVTRAHGEAYMAGAEQAPGVAGFRFLLSPRHPRPDICDLFATQNLHGLGRGVYPTRASCPWPAHPNTLSFVVAVFGDEVSAQDQAGKETTLQALARLSPEIRAGALGVTKAAYFDRGLLTTGMVRSKLGGAGGVMARLTRQGKLPAR
jgi:hypothetical protein